MVSVLDCNIKVLDTIFTDFWGNFGSQGQKKQTPPGNEEATSAGACYKTLSQIKLILMFLKLLQMKYQQKIE